MDKSIRRMQREISILRAVIRKVEIEDERTELEKDIHECFKNVIKANAKRNKVTYCCVTRSC